MTSEGSSKEAKDISFSGITPQIAQDEGGDMNNLPARQQNLKYNTSFKHSLYSKMHTYLISPPMITPICQHLKYAVLQAHRELKQITHVISFHQLRLIGQHLLDYLSCRIHTGGVLKLFPTRAPSASEMRRCDPPEKPSE